MFEPVGAESPEALHAALEDAFNRGDVEAYANVYDDDAVLVVPPDGRSLRGRGDIRAHAATVFLRRPRMTIEVRKKLETDGLALTQTRWRLRIPGPDGGAELDGRAAVVSRRRPDGTWVIVLDDPMSSALPSCPGGAVPWV